VILPLGWKEANAVVLMAVLAAKSIFSTDCADLDLGSVDRGRRDLMSNHPESDDRSVKYLFIISLFCGGRLSMYSSEETAAASPP